jgi:4-hydroxy-tetrahydrodipicolinate reductase
VVATTGLTEDTQMMLPLAAKVIPVFYSANMSLGINVLIKALQSITPALEADFDIEIIEKHHNQKLDAPSGTALLLADSINDSCETKKEYLYGREGSDLVNDRKQMGIHAVRGGTIPGEHIVIYAGQDEIIELKHTALSREIFANGALKAAEFLADQPAGFYSMQNLIDK